MHTFSVPVREHPTREVYSFSVPQQSVVLAGSRNLELPEFYCSKLAEAFSRHGFSFFIGCARGVDQSFRKALASSPWKEHTMVACAFESRKEVRYSYGLYATKVVPDNLPPKAALHRRTVWMVKRCSMVCLFPEYPATGKWGKGSTLAFETAMYYVKPVFVATEKPPKNSVHYRVLPATLFAMLKGYWCLPHPYGEGGTCDEEW